MIKQNQLYGFSTCSGGYKTILLVGAMISILLSLVMMMMIVAAVVVTTNQDIPRNSNAIDNYHDGMITINNTIADLQYVCMILYWSFIQWIPTSVLLTDSQSLNSFVWKYWEDIHYLKEQQLYQARKTSNSNDINATKSSFSPVKTIPTLYIQDHAIDELVPYIISKYGKDWMKRPLLLKGLWKMNNDDVCTSSDSNVNDDAASCTTHGTTIDCPQRRRLSLEGLLHENYTIPYFTDARQVGAITPDAMGTIQDIVYNITYHNRPHKIATQLFVQKYPELLRDEVIPYHIASKLFDPPGSTSSYFTPNAVRGSGPYQIFPALTTVPLFVANSQPLPKVTTTGSHTNIDANTMSQKKAHRPTAVAHTALHCEPIGNIAVQLSGEKLWTLVESRYSHLLRPQIAPNGRAFFVSSLPISQLYNQKEIEDDDNDDNIAVSHQTKIPYYQVVTEAGDALWVPPWTWHRVDYVKTLNESASATTATTTIGTNQSITNNIAIGASVFHFRPMDYIRNNPLYATLIVPAIILELIGWKTQ